MSREQRGIFDYLDDEGERPFLLVALDGRLDDADRIAYAQIVATKDPERAEWLRLEVALHSHAADDPAVIARFVALSHELGLDYVNVLLRDTIVNCGSEDAKKESPRVRFAFACPKRWETLAPTENESVRHCQECQEHVYRCDTLAEAADRARVGQCIAVPKHLVEHATEDHVLGRPDPLRKWAVRIFPG